MQRLHAAIFVLLGFGVLAHGQKPYKPTAEQLKASYLRANEFQKRAENKVFNASLTFGWIGNEAFWYRRDKPDGKLEFMRADCRTKEKGPAFDHAALAKALSTKLNRTVEADKLPFRVMTVDATTGAVGFQLDRSSENFKFDPKTGALERVDELDIQALTTEIQEEPTTEDPAPFVGPHREPVIQESRARVREGQVEVLVDGTWTVVTKQGGYARAEIQTGTSKIVAFRLIPGDRKLVYLLKSAIGGTTRAVLEQRMYDQPGDKLDEFETWLIDASAKTETKLDLPPITGGGQPWAGPPGVRWRGGHAFLSFPIRGYSAHKIVKINPADGKITTVVDEKSKTFVDQSKTAYWILEDGKKILWQSERDGRNHLYLIDTETGQSTQVTKGPWLVRGISHVDEAGRLIWFMASGFGDPATTDPYHIHACRINLDGSGFVRLTEGDGSHSVMFSPDRKFLMAAYSRVDEVPVHEIRDATTGKLVVQLEKASVSTGIQAPERFVAKGRDGVTDIWGIVIRPSNFDSKLKYPVIEYIYAGPHDSHVPKGYRPFFNMHRLAELGFIVVQIDGMGTNNRGKAFHDVCYKNIADAGFPDRILWMKALAKKYPQADVTRVGIYGTSAGGQNSTTAVLNHGDFYKVAVSSCGCHDNRIDKMWWNEQWMGYPVASHYDEQSNINLARKLTGKLMLIVGEQDRNVPPETTFRLADALIKAGKEFEFVIIPGADHTDGGPYGERKRRDFFVKHLLGVDPPSWNGG